MNLTQLKQLSALRRLNKYLDVAADFCDQRQETVSVAQIAGAVGLPATLVKEDFEILKVTENDEIVFETTKLADSLELCLSLYGDRSEAVLVAEGFLGEMLMKTAGFYGASVKLLAIFSPLAAEEPSLSGIPCYGMAKLESLTRRLQVPLGIVCVPHKSAQGVVDLLVAAGVTGIWNWSGCDVNVPASVAVYREDDMGLELVRSSK